MKKNILLIIAIAFLGSFSSEAQSRKGGSEKIRSFKIAFLTEKLNLSENEAQKFWPIYNKYDKKMMQLRKKERFSIKKRYIMMEVLINYLKKDSKEILEKIQSIKKQQYEIKTAFHNKISKIVSFKKILTLEISEHEFNRKLMRKYRGKRHKNKKEAK